MPKDPNQALWAACDTGDMAAVLKLLAADRSRITNLNDCAIRAVSQGHAAIAEVIIKQGDYHLTPLIFACLSCSAPSVLRLLVERDARSLDRSLISNRLATAADYGEIECCRILLEHGADASSGGSAALKGALDNADHELIALFLSRGARLSDVRTRDRKKALQHIPPSGLAAVLALFPDTPLAEVAEYARALGNDALSNALTGTGARLGASGRLRDRSLHEQRSGRA